MISFQDHFFTTLFVIITVAIISSVPSAFANTNVDITPGSSTSGCETTNSCLSNHKITIKAGDTVTWKNNDSVPHSIASGSTATGLDGEFNSGLFDAGESFSHTFTQAGTYNYFDLLHPWIEGVVIVESGGVVGPGPGTGTNEIRIVSGSSTPGCETTNSCLSNHKITIKAGDTVTWKNNDSVPHSIASGSTATRLDGEFNSGLFDAGESFSHTFTQAGTYNYFDLLHPWIEGVVVVESGGVVGPGPGTGNVVKQEKTKIILEKPRENALIGGILPFKGKLTTGDGVPIPRVEVVIGAIIDLQPKILLFDITDQNGEFSRGWKVKSISSVPTILVFAGFGGNGLYDLSVSDFHKITIGKPSFSFTTEKSTYEYRETIPLYFKGTPLDDIEIVITSELGVVSSRTCRIQQNGLVTCMIFNSPRLPQGVLPAGDYTISATSKKLGVEETVKITIEEEKKSLTTIDIHVSTVLSNPEWSLGGVRGILLYGEGDEGMIEYNDLVSRRGLVFEDVPYDPSLEYILLIELTDGKYFVLKDPKNFGDDGIMTEPITLALDPKNNINYFRISVDEHLPYLTKETNYYLARYYVYMSWLVDFYTNYINEKPTFVEKFPLLGDDKITFNQLWYGLSATMTKDVLENYEAKGSSKSQSFKNAITKWFMPAAISDHIGYREAIWSGGYNLEDSNRLFRPSDNMELTIAALLWDMIDYTPQKGERWGSLSEDSSMDITEAYRILTLAQVNNVKDLYDYLITHYDYILVDGRVGPHEKKVVEDLFTIHWLHKGKPSEPTTPEKPTPKQLVHKCAWTTPSTKVCGWMDPSLEYKCTPTGSYTKICGWR